MNPQTLSVHTSGFTISQGDDPSFVCTGELPALLVSIGEDDLRIELGNCLYDRTGAIKTTSSFGITVDCEQRCAPGGNRTITMSGTVDNHQGQVIEFTFCLFMWLGQRDALWSPDSSCCHAWSRVLSIPSAGHRIQQLSDSVFDVLLYRNNPVSARMVAGNGRGFLLFQTGRTGTIG